LYVHQVEPATNTVILGPEEGLRRSRCEVSDLNLFDASLANETMEVHVKVRYATPAIPATIRPVTPTRLGVQFQTPQRALSPGQSAVFYRDTRILGGGIIQPF
jgi:tRNA-specific 2-thiouridylase